MSPFINPPYNPFTEGKKKTITINPNNIIINSVSNSGNYFFIIINWAGWKIVKYSRIWNPIVLIFGSDTKLRPLIH